MDSPMGSGVSVSSLSVISDIGPLDGRAGNDDDVVRQKSDTSTGTPHHPITPGHCGKLFFEPGDGDVKLCVNGVYFETHKYLIKRFSVLRSQLCHQAPNATLSILHDNYGAEEVGNTLQVLYATVLEGPFEFDYPVLLSALRIATAYDHPVLRAYAIGHLEKAELTAIERIKIAREFGMRSWEEPAYLELCARDEPITSEEASVLGMDSFVRLAGMREMEQRRRGREDAYSGGEEKPATFKDKGGVKYEGKGQSAPTNQYDQEAQEAGDSLQSDAHASNNTIAPSFVGVQTNGFYVQDTWTDDCTERQLNVPNCTCHFENKVTRGVVRCQCTLPACAVAAFKRLEVQQLAHANSITNLKLSVDRLIANPSNPLPDLLSKPV